MENKKYFTQLEILEDLKEAITDLRIDHYDDLIHEAFSLTYYVTGRKEAEEALEQYGVFEAIGEVKQFELDSFGEVYTKLEKPEAVADMLYYILGYETLYYNYPELSDAFGSVVYQEVNAENDRVLLEVIDELIAGLK